MLASHIYITTEIYYLLELTNSGFFPMKLGGAAFTLEKFPESFIGEEREIREIYCYTSGKEPSHCTIIPGKHS